MSVDKERKFLPSTTAVASCSSSRPGGAGGLEVLWGCNLTGIWGPTGDMGGETPFPCEAGGEGPLTLGVGGRDSLSTDGVGGRESPSTDSISSRSSGVLGSDVMAHSCWGGEIK